MVNLDGIDKTDLYEFVTSTRGIRPRRAAKHLFPDKPTGHVKTTKDLNAYAWNKITAMSCRERGDIKTALHYEGICDRIYAALPEYAKW